MNMSETQTVASSNSQSSREDSSRQICTVRKKESEESDTKERIAVSIWVEKGQGSCHIRGDWMV